VTPVTRSPEHRTRPGKPAEPKAHQGSAAEHEPLPLSITLRDIEIPPAPAESRRPAGEEFVVSDPEVRPAPWLGDPEAERAAQRAARRAQVRKDRVRDTAAEPSVAPATPAPDAVAPPEPAIAVPAAPPPPLPDAVAMAELAAPADATPLQSVQPAAAAAPSPSIAPRAQAATAAPAILLLRASSAAPDPLCDQLRAFGFDLQVRQDLPDLPAPWPFAAVFVDQALQPTGGGDSIDLCNEVRERSRLPGVLKPVLVLVADQLSATNRVRAGLAGCNEILLGAITRGGVAKVLDSRGIALPSDARHG